MKPGTLVKHRYDVWVGTVLDPNSDKVSSFKRRVLHDLTQEWVYVEIQSGKVEGFPPTMLIPQTLEYELQQALADVDRIRKAIILRDAPKAQETWESIFETFTVTVKYADEDHVFFIANGKPDSATTSEFMKNYARA